MTPTVLVGLDCTRARRTRLCSIARPGRCPLASCTGCRKRPCCHSWAAWARSVLAVYEAGPTGFGLAREAGRRGLDVRVISPGSIPRAPGDKVKTDKRDSLRLLRLLAAGELTFVFVPSVVDEHFRDLVRAIEDLRGELMRAPSPLEVAVAKRPSLPGRQGVDAQARGLAALSSFRGPVRPG
jgi:transposase